ncbi:MAG TPA: Qat anti-phage system QueC-like protein QatC [Chthoniobacterales bacterium]|nr:Qat anti-phage system QueC-like protein QatC [Chthoniobacterales bacterium]
MKVIVEQKPDEAVHELTKLEIKVSGIDPRFILDLDFSAIVDRSRQPNSRTLDFLVISAVTYAVDKIVRRDTTTDRWKRTLDVTVPVSAPASWRNAAASLSETVSFLTGDVWTFRFAQAAASFQKRRANRRKSAIGFPRSPVISLLSGGVDSFVAAIDLLAEYPDQQLLFVSHYDRHVKGPAKDQSEISTFLSQRFPSRVSHLQVRVGTVPAEGEKHSFEISFRSRSLIFLGLAVYAASKIGDDTPIIIPENGPISLNMPLNPSRRGACSTRTVHPFFLRSLRNTLSEAGINHPIRNPYEFKTKGELITDCRDLQVFLEALSKTNSCAKAARRMHWKNRKARACGACVACLFRRASLHAIGQDSELFGHDVFRGQPQAYPDFHALLGLIATKPTDRDIARSLIANGRLPLKQIDAYVGVIRRMIDEVVRWVSDKGSSKTKSLARISKRQR